MAQVYVFRVEEDAGQGLYETLGAAGFAFRPVPHARWSAKGDEATVTWYRSGKLVVQGRGAEAFLTRYLPDAPPRVGAEDEPSPVVTSLPEIGSDESGKGDYFGPLVVAAALATPAQVERLAALGVEDSKAATDAHVRRLEGVLLGLLPNAVRTLDPATYNEAYTEVGNLNRLLGRLHAEVIEEVLAAAGPGRVRIVVDRFGDPEHVRRHLGSAARSHPFVMPTRGERHPAVAAASFLARAAFLRGFCQVEDLAGGPLPRGSSDPRILEAARRLRREGGRDWLGRFAKLHFRVTQRAENGFR